MINYKAHTPVQKEWGYEIPTTFTDSETGEEYNHIMLFHKVPTKIGIEKMANFWIDKINLPEEPTEETMLKSEVEQLLVDKGYLSSGEILEDLTKK